MDKFFSWSGILLAHERFALKPAVPVLSMGVWEGGGG